MKSGAILFSIVLVIAAAALMGCAFGEDPLPYISGSVTVADVADWTNLELGVFYASEVDTDDNYQFYFETDYESSTSDYIYRATYSQNNDATYYQFAPELSAPTSITQTSGVNGTFRADFDVNATTDGYFYALAWIDTNANGLLDLKDSSSEAVQISDSEFNRCPIYTPDGYYAHTFYNDSDYGYKFNGYDGTTNYIEDLSEMDQSAFRFDMTPALSGW